jgi:hypothetical protein
MRSESPLTKPPSITGPTGRRFRKVLIAMCGFVALLGSNLLYVRVASRWLRSPDLAALLNRRPERFRITWRDASSPFPGWLVVHDLDLAGRTRRTRWSLHADEVHGALSLPPLLRRHLAFHDLVGSGVTIRVARILPPGAAPIAGQPGIVPSFPQTSEQFEAALRAVPKGPRWTIELKSVSLEKIHELWLERWRIAGAMKAHGGLRLRLGRDAAVYSSRLDLLDASITVVGRPTVEHLRGSVAARATPYSPRQERGWAAVRHVSGELRLAGQLDSLEFLVGLLPPVPWLAIDGGEGAFRARLLLAQGKLRAGSSAEIQARTASVEILDYLAQGQAILSWQVERDRMVGRVDLARCEIRRRGAAAPYAQAPRLHLALASNDLQLDGRLADVSGVADLPRAEVPDLRYYNAYLPADSGLALTGGRGVLSSRVTIEPSGRTRGRILLSATDVAATARGLALRGRCGITVALASEDVRSRRFDLDGSRLRCEGVEIRDPEKKDEEPSSRDWWAKGTIDDGFVVPGAADYLSLQGAVEARDALPIFALFGDHPGAKIAAHFFRGKGVAATGRIDLSSAAWRAAGNGHAGARLSADARLAGRRGRIDGALLAGIGGRRIGLELAGRERKIHWRGAEAWFAGGAAPKQISRHPG